MKCVPPSNSTSRGCGPTASFLPSPIRMRLQAPQWLQDGMPRLKMEAHLKERRLLLDPKAEPERPRLIP